MTRSIKYNPVQYYKGHWLETVRPLIKTNPRVRAELERLGNNYLDDTHGIFEEDLDPDELAEEMSLRAHEFRVRCKEHSFLCDHLDSYALADLSLVIARELFPKQKWEIVGEEEDVVVADKKRTMVFDIKNCLILSGLGSLALCGDPVGMADRKAVEESLRVREARHLKLNDALAIVQGHLREHAEEQAKTNAEVISFPGAPGE